ncbi:MAG: hypothetical protein ACN6NU_05010 [Acinetobacter sp.]
MQFLNMALKGLGLGLIAAASISTQAAEWSDTSIALSYGTEFSEPFKNNEDGSAFEIEKHIISLVHVSGYKYGSNFFQVNLHQSNNEPNGNVSGEGAQEAYVIYRHTFDYEKIFGTIQDKPDFLRGVGFIVGGDWNTKNDDYGSNREMWVAGPSIMFNVPGFLNFNILGYYESNKPNVIDGKYTYDPYLALQLSWGLPIQKTGLEFNGIAVWMSEKGKNEFGGDTKAETFIDTSLMYDIGNALGAKAQTFKIGPAYQYWKNKYGNDTKGEAGKGATASVPMIRAAYHF